MNQKREFKKKWPFSPTVLKYLFQQKQIKPLAFSVVSILAVILGFSFLWFGYDVYRFGVQTTAGNRIFYDQFHVNRHFITGRNVRGQTKYHIVSGYYDFRKTLEREGFVFYVHSQGRIRPGDLDGFDIYFIGEQTPQGTIMTKEEREVIFNFIKNGGSMWATAEHTNVHGITDLFNPFMEGTDIQARYDSLCEENGTENSRNWVDINKFTDHPLVHGLKNVYFFNGCSLDTPFGVAFSKENTWSDAQNPENPPTHNGNRTYDPGELRGPLTALAARTFGKGKIAVTCDHNPFSNPSIYMGSDQQLAINAMKWLGKSRTNRSLYSVGIICICTLILFITVWRRQIIPLRWIGGTWAVGLLAAIALLVYQKQEQNVFRILFAEVNNPDVSARGKEGSSVWNFMQDIQKSDEVTVWMKNRILSGYDALGLVAPTKKYTKPQLEMINSYLHKGKSVIYMATADSLRSEAGQQIAQLFDFEVATTPQKRTESKRREFNLKGVRKIYRNVEEVTVSSKIPLTKFTGKGWSVALTLINDSESIDLVAEKKIGQGRMIVISPLDFFSKFNRKRRCSLCLVDLIINMFEWISEQ